MPRHLCYGYRLLLVLAAAAGGLDTENSILRRKKDRVALTHIGLYVSRKVGNLVERIPPGKGIDDMHD